MKQPHAELAVYVVWLPMLGSDTRSAVEPDLLSDSRVSQYWDEDRVVGRWLADARVGGAAYSSLVWDAFYVFGAKASWNERPDPVAAFGSPVVSETGTLERAIRPLLR